MENPGSLASWCIRVRQVPCSAVLHSLLDLLIIKLSICNLHQQVSTKVSPHQGWLRGLSKLSVWAHLRDHVRLPIFNSTCSCRQTQVREFASRLPMGMAPKKAYYYLTRLSARHQHADCFVAQPAQTARLTYDNQGKGVIDVL
jgi:hypothetical protein